MSDPFNEALASAGSGEKIRGAFSKYSRPGERHGGTVVSRDLFQSRDPDDNKLQTWDDGRPIMKARIIVQTDERGEANEDGTPDDGRRAIYIKWWGDDLKALKEAVGQNDLDTGGWFGAVFEKEEAPKKAAFSGRKIYSYKYQPPAFMDAAGGPAPQSQQDPGSYANPQQYAPPTPPFQQAAQPPAQQPLQYDQGGGFGNAGPQQVAAQQTQPIVFGQGQPAQQPRTANDYKQAAAAGFGQDPAAAQQAPAPQAQPVPQQAAPQQSQVSAVQIQTLISQGFTDDDIMNATGATREAVSMVRSLNP